MKFFKSLKRFFAKRTTMLVLFVAAFLAAVCMLNVFINALSTKYSWYFYTEPKYEHTIGTASDSVLSGVDRTKKTEIYFMMPSEELEANSVYSLVWNTAEQFAERYEFVQRPLTLNTFTDTKKIESYINVDEDGNTDSLSKTSVIVDCGGRYLIRDMSNFFDLDENQSITSYRGEEAFAFLIRYVMTSSQPKAMFTTNHGEQSTQSVLSALVFSGYDVGTVNLIEEDIAQDVEFIFISLPIYDFEQTTQESAVRSEITKLREFVDRGGNVVVIKDPYSGTLKNLEGFLSDYGMKINNGIVSDGTNSVTANGRSVIAEFAQNSFASGIANRAANAGDMSFVVCESASITLTESASANVNALIVSGDGARIDLFDGKSESGTQVLAATAQKKGAKGGHTVTLFPSSMTFSSTFMNTDSYLNKSVLYSVIEAAGTQKAPVGATQLKFESTYLEDLTVRESNIYAVILIAVLPVTVLTVGAVILTRRKHR